MASRRPVPFLWASWLPRFVVGDATCEWSLWHMANFDYAKMPQDDMSEWRRKHTNLLRKLQSERKEAGYSVSCEDENKFKLRIAPTGLEVVGIPDLIARRLDEAVVIDAKTGQCLDQHIIQVKLYMACLPLYAPQFRSAPLFGEVAYASGHRVPIRPEEAQGEFKDTLREWLEVIQTPAPPRKVASKRNCQFCKIGPTDCPDRVNDEAVSVTIDDF